MRCISIGSGSGTVEVGNIYADHVELAVKLDTDIASTEIVEIVCSRDSSSIEEIDPAA